MAAQTTAATLDLLQLPEGVLLKILQQVASAGSIRLLRLGSVCEKLHQLVYDAARMRIQSVTIFNITTYEHHAFDWESWLHVEGADWLRLLHFAELWQVVMADGANIVDGKAAPVGGSHAPVDHDFFFRAFSDEGISEVAALELVAFVTSSASLGAVRAAGCCDWNRLKPDLNYGRGGLLFLAIIRRWPRVCSVLIDLVTEPHGLKNRASYHVDCGGVFDIEKGSAMDFIQGREWNSNPIPWFDSDDKGDVDDADYDEVWLPLAEKLAHRLVAIRGY